MKNYYTSVVKFSNNKELIIEYGSDYTYFSVLDKSLPKVYITGNSYKFNKNMVYRKSNKI